MTTQTDKEQGIFVRANNSVAYGVVMGLMNRLRTSGYLKIWLVAMEADPSHPRRGSWNVPWRLAFAVHSHANVLQ